MEREIRRNQSNLIILGTGIIAFGAWTIVRFLFTYFMQLDYLKAYTGNEIKSNLLAGSKAVVTDEMINTFLTIVLVAILAILVVDIILRLFVGLSARKEGRGNKKGYGYLIAAVILIIIHAVSVVMDLLSIFEGNYLSLETYISIIVDTSSAIIVIELIVSSVRLKKLTSQINNQ